MSEVTCQRHHTEMEHEDCEACDGDGMSLEHDCGEDSCPCLSPQPNVICGTCGGFGFYWVCFTCVGEDEASCAAPTKGEP